MEQYVQSNQDAENLGLYAGIAAVGVAGGAALAYRASNTGKGGKDGNGLFSKKPRGSSIIDEYENARPGKFRKLLGAVDPGSLPNTAINSKIAETVAGRVIDGLAPDVATAFNDVQRIYGEQGMGDNTPAYIEDLMKRGGEQVKASEVGKLARNDARSKRAMAILNDPNATIKQKEAAQAELDKQAKLLAKAENKAAGAVDDVAATMVGGTGITNNSKLSRGNHQIAPSNSQMHKVRSINVPAGESFDLSNANLVRDVGLSTSPNTPNIPNTLNRPNMPYIPNMPANAGEIINSSVQDLPRMHFAVRDPQGQFVLERRTATNYAVQKAGEIDSPFERFDPAKVNAEAREAKRGKGSPRVKFTGRKLKVNL